MFVILYISYLTLVNFKFLFKLQFIAIHKLFVNLHIFFGIREFLIIFSTTLSYYFLIDSLDHLISRFIKFQIMLYFVPPTKIIKFYSEVVKFHILFINFATLFLNFFISNLTFHIFIIVCIFLYLILNFQYFLIFHYFLLLYNLILLYLIIKIIFF